MQKNNVLIGVVFHQFKWMYLSKYKISVKAVQKYVIFKLRLSLSSELIHTALEFAQVFLRLCCIPVLENLSRQ